MLKIKDNVDLKELEKFGFETNGQTYYIIFIKCDFSISVAVNLKDKTIWMQNDNYDLDYACEIPNVFYDLIKADLVEKVDERKKVYR